MTKLPTTPLRPVADRPRGTKRCREKGTIPNMASPMSRNSAPTRPSVRGLVWAAPKSFPVSAAAIPIAV